MEMNNDTIVKAIGYIGSGLIIAYWCGALSSTLSRADAAVSSTMESAGTFCFGDAATPAETPAAPIPVVATPQKAAVKPTSIPAPAAPRKRKIMQPPAEFLKSGYLNPGNVFSPPTERRSRPLPANTPADCSHTRAEMVQPQQKPAEQTPRPVEIQPAASVQHPRTTPYAFVPLLPSTPAQGQPAPAEIQQPQQTYAEQLLRAIAYLDATAAAYDPYIAFAERWREHQRAPLESMVSCSTWAGVNPFPAINDEQFTRDLAAALA